MFCNRDIRERFGKIDDDIASRVLREHMLFEIEFANELSHVSTLGGVRTDALVLVGIRRIYLGIMSFSDEVTQPNLKIGIDQC